MSARMTIIKKTDHQIYCDNHFMRDVNQISMLYTLNLYSAVCQFYLSNTGRKRK